MRIQPVLCLLLASSAYASWFGNSADDQYTSWSSKDLKAWLNAHNIDIPASANSKDDLVALVQSNWDSASVWTRDQYSNAQKSFSSLRDSSFETWDESQLRSWLLEQGVVAPKGKKEELQLLAKHRYNDYLAASNRWGNWAADASRSASGTAYSIAATATNEAVATFDDAKDYVYSTWDDNRMRTYLEEKGLIKTKEEKKREEMLAMMRDAYAKTSNPIWDAWSTSYIHSWLVSHNLVSPTPSATEKARTALMEKMNNYYYTTNSYVWDTWTDSELKAWLVQNGVIKSDAQVKRDKMVKMMEDSYTSASSTIFSAWSDSQLRAWLIDQGYLRSDAQVKRDEMIKLMQDKYKTASATATPYLAWPNNRLRAYLVESGVTEKSLPQTREGLLQKTRSFFGRQPEEPQTMVAKITEILNSGVGAAEDKLVHVWELLSGYSKEKYDGASKSYDAEKAQFGEKAEEGKKSFWGKYEQGKEDVKSEL